MADSKISQTFMIIFAVIASMLAVILCGCS